MLLCSLESGSQPERTNRLRVAAEARSGPLIAHPACSAPPSAHFHTLIGAVSNVIVRWQVASEESMYPRVYGRGPHTLASTS